MSVPADLARIRGNVGTMIDKGAPEPEIETYLASEGVTAQDLQGVHMSPDAEAAYVALAKDPRSTAMSLQAYARAQGFDIADQDAADFIAKRARKGGTVGDRVSYTGDLTRAPQETLAPQVPPNTTADNVAAGIGSFLDGVIPNAGRNLDGLAFALKGKEFAAGEQDYDGLKANFERDHPALASAAGWGGFGSSFLLPAARVARGGGMVAHAINGAATGAGFGALSGALNDTGDGRLENATNGFLVGGTLGALAGPVARKVGDTIGAVRRNIPGVNEALTALENIPRRVTGRPLVPASAAAHAQAERIINRDMAGETIDAGMGSGTVPATPENVQAEVLRRHGLGTPAMPGDVTERLRSSTASALQGQGTMATRARGVLAARQAQAGLRVRQHITNELGPVVDPLAESAAIHVRASAASGPGYREAYAQPVVLTPEIEGIMGTPAFQNALPQAVRNIRNAQRNPTELGFRLDAHGNIAGVETLSTEGFDQVIRAMRDNGRAAANVNPITGQVTNTTNSVHINQRAGDLKAALSAQNPAYRDVTANYADEMALRDALERGGDVAKLSGPEIEAQRRAMPQHAQEAWTAGARTALADDAIQAGLRPNVNVAQAARQGMGLSGAGVLSGAGDTAKQRAIESMVGRPGVLSRVDDRLEAENQAFKTYAAVSNPKASSRDLEALAGNLGTAADVAWKVTMGRLPRALATVALKANPKGTAAFRRGVQDRTVGILSATTPDAVREGMGALSSRALADRTAQGVLSRRAINLSKVGIMGAAGQSADPMPIDDATDAPWAPYNAEEDLRAPLYRTRR